MSIVNPETEQVVQEWIVEQPASGSEGYTEEDADLIVDNSDSSVTYDSTTC